MSSHMDNFPPLSPKPTQLSSPKKTSPPKKTSTPKSLMNVSHPTVSNLETYVKLFYQLTSNLQKVLVHLNSQTYQVHGFIFGGAVRDYLTGLTPIRSLDTRTITVLNGNEPCLDITIKNPIDLETASELARGRLVNLTTKPKVINGRLLWLNGNNAAMQIQETGGNQHVVLINDVKNLEILDLSADQLSRFSNQYELIFPMTQTTKKNPDPAVVSYAFKGISWYQHMHLDLDLQEQSDAYIGAARLYINVNNATGTDIPADIVEFYGGNQESNVSALAHGEAKMMKAISLESASPGAQMSRAPSVEEKPAINVGEVGLVYHTQFMTLKNGTNRTLCVDSKQNVKTKFVYFANANGDCQYEIELKSPWDFSSLDHLISIYLTTNGSKRLINLTSPQEATRKDETMIIPMGQATEVLSQVELVEHGEEWWQTTTIYRLTSNKERTVEIRVPPIKEAQSILIYTGSNIRKLTQQVDVTKTTRGFLICAVKLQTNESLYVKIVCV